MDLKNHTERPYSSLNATDGIGRYIAIETRSQIHTTS